MNRAKALIERETFDRNFTAKITIKSTTVAHVTIGLMGKTTFPIKAVRNVYNTVFRWSSLLWFYLRDGSRYLSSHERKAATCVLIRDDSNHLSSGALVMKIGRAKKKQKMGGEGTAPVYMKRSPSFVVSQT